MELDDEDSLLLDPVEVGAPEEESDPPSLDDDETAPVDIDPSEVLVDSEELELEVDMLLVGGSVAPVELSSGPPEVPPSSLGTGVDPQAIGRPLSVKRNILWLKSNMAQSPAV